MVPSIRAAAAIVAASFALFSNQSRSNYFGYPVFHFQSNRSRFRRWSPSDYRAKYKRLMARRARKGYGY